MQAHSKRRTILAAVAALALGAAGEARQPLQPTPVAAQPAQARPAYRVVSIHTHTVQLRKVHPPRRTLWVPRDSLSLTIRVGQVVRPCNRPVPAHGNRVVTWCRDQRANQR